MRPSTLYPLALLALVALPLLLVGAVHLVAYVATHLEMVGAFVVAGLYLLLTEPAAK